MVRKMICAGIDLGNSHVKGFSDEAKSGIVLPNYFARKSEFESENDFRETYQLNEYESHLYKGESYVWGQDIHFSNHPISSYTVQGRYASKAYRLLSDFALSELIGDEELVDLVLISGCPSAEKGVQKIEEQLAEVFTGTKVVGRNGVERVIKIDRQAFGVLAQPTGTLMDMYLDESGTKVIDPDLFHQKVAVLDIGGGTTDADLLVKLNPVADKRQTARVGLNYAYQRVADWINRENPNAEATMYSVERQLRSGTDSYRISARHAIDVSEIKAKVYREVSEEIISAISQKWTDRDRYDRIVLTGGGASALIPYFKEWEADVEIVSEPQTANCRGYLKYARRLASKLQG